MDLRELVLRDRCTWPVSLTRQRWRRPYQNRHSNGYTFIRPFHVLDFDALRQYAGVGERELSSHRAVLLVCEDDWKK